MMPAKTYSSLSVKFDWKTLQWSVIDLRLVRLLRDAIARARARAQARKSFPNALGNYAGKRTPKPNGSPLSPDQRFARLAAHYQSCAQTYYSPPSRRRDPSNLRHKNAA